MRRNQFESFNVADAVLRLRGCPFGTTKDDVIKFFAGLDLVEGGIVIPNDEMGRPGGEAYAQFRSKEIAEEAMKLNREKMGHRYIELFKSSLQEMKAAERGELPSAMPGRAGGRGGFSGGRPGPYDRMEGMGGGFGGRNIKGPGGRGGRDPTTGWKEWAEASVEGISKDPAGVAAGTLRPDGRNGRRLRWKEYQRTRRAWRPGPYDRMEGMGGGFGGRNIKGPGG